MLTVHFLQRILKRNMITQKLIAGGKSITVNVRQMLEKDIPQIKELRRRNNFHDPVSLYAMCLEIDPSSVVVVDDAQGNIAGIITGFKGIENLCVGGMRTVHEDYRNMGLSSKVLFPRALELAANRTILTVAEIKELLYNKKRIPYMTKNFALIEFESKQKVDSEKLSSHKPQGVEIQKFNDSHLATLLEYDHLTSGYNREAVVKFNCRDPYGETVAAHRNGKCVGYGTIKLDIQGDRKLGPLYADCPEIAEALLKLLLESFKSVGGFHATALSNNASALSMYEKLGEMRKIINYRLCNKEMSWPEYENVYSTFELEIQPI